MASGLHADVEALLALQAEDAALHELEIARAALAPRTAALDKARAALADRLERARAALAAEEKKQRELQARVREHKDILEKNVAQLDVVKRLREATAAMAQVERARRVLADEEGELAAIARRITDAKATVSQLEGDTAALEGDQATQRAEIAAEAARLGGEIAAMVTKRDAAQAPVPKALLNTYVKVRTKRPGRTLVALSGPACGACDTAVPRQRHSQMMNTGKVEICEVCGVLMYFQPPAAG